jgi:hypothetical protein
MPIDQIFASLMITRCARPCTKTRASGFCVSSCMELVLGRGWTRFKTYDVLRRRWKLDAFLLRQLGRPESRGGFPEDVVSETITPVRRSSTSHKNTSMPVDQTLFHSWSTQTRPCTKTRAASWMLFLIMYGACVE